MHFEGNHTNIIIHLPLTFIVPNFSSYNIFVWGTLIPVAITSCPCMPLHASPAGVWEQAAGVRSLPGLPGGGGGGRDGLPDGGAAGPPGGGGPAQPLLQLPHGAGGGELRQDCHLWVRTYVHACAQRLK